MGINIIDTVNLAEQCGVVKTDRGIKCPHCFMEGGFISNLMDTGQLFYDCIVCKFSVSLKTEINPLLTNDQVKLIIPALKDRLMRVVYDEAKERQRRWSREEMRKVKAKAQEVRELLPKRRRK